MNKRCEVCGKANKNKSKLCTNCRKLEVKRYRRAYYLRTTANSEERLRRKRIREARELASEKGPCSVDGCPNKAKIKGICKHHYDVNYYHTVIKPKDQEDRSLATKRYYERNKAIKSRRSRRNPVPILQKEVVTSAFIARDIQHSSPEQILGIFEKFKKGIAVYAG